MIHSLWLSIIYVLMLVWIYDVEFTVFWTYMRFSGQFDLVVLLTALGGTILLSLILPVDRSARSYLVQLLHYFFFIPSVVYLSYNQIHADYVFALAMSAVLIYFGSALPVRVFAAPGFTRKALLAGIAIVISITLLFYALFGGLERFNLNLEAVYQFRRETAEELPEFLGYVFSNVSNVLIPASIVLAIYMRSFALAVVGVAAGTALFGMTHHKTVLFVALMVFGFFWLLDRSRRPYVVALVPITLVLICTLEILYQTYIAQERHVGLVTSYIVRRALLVPPVLDVASVELFSQVPQYFWSTSRLSMGLVSNPHGVSAPFLMGSYFFSDADMSANPGNIGSGYSQAGLVGVVIYSALTGLLISFVNKIGKRIGHSIAAAISIPTVVLIVTSTDLTTALLTHGLAALILILSVLPRKQSDTPALEQRV